MTVDEALNEYKKLAHAVQSGIAMSANYDGRAYDAKHMRTGLNCVMADLGSLARLMIEKGVITESEYFEALLEGLRREKAQLEREIENIVGAPVNLI